MNERWNDAVPFVQQLPRGLQNLEVVARPFVEGLARIAEAFGPYVLAFQYFGQSSSRPVSDGAIVTKVLVIGAGFFQAMPVG